MSIDFKDLDAKSEGRKAVSKRVKLSLTALQPFFQKAEPRTFQRVYNNFVDAYPDEAAQISNLKTDGLGPGEVLTWFLFDNITLGGKNSPIDLYADSLPFAEMKAGDYLKRDHALVGFKITKDNDPAVDLLTQDLKTFSSSYYKITCQNLQGWKSGDVPTSALQSWESIDLKKLAKQKATVPVDEVPVLFHPNGGAYLLGQKKAFASWKEPCFQEKVAQFMHSDVEIPVDNKTSTLQKIVKRWRELAFKNYLEGKRLALISTTNLRMVYFDLPTKEMIGLYRIGRNQPQAKVYLPKAGGNKK